jgi:hypothetical protein
MRLWKLIGFSRQIVHYSQVKELHASIRYSHTFFAQVLHIALRIRRKSQLTSQLFPWSPGKPLDPPNLPRKDEKPAWMVGTDDSGKSMGLSANLSSFVETLRQTASSVDVEELVKRAKSKKNKDDAG